MTKNILVSGGFGFIGSNLVKNLVESNHRVVIIDDFSTGSINNLQNLLGKVRIIPGDSSIVEKTELPELECIYHLGIPSSSPMYKRNPRLVGETITAFTRILERVRQDQPNVKIVYASTSSIYNGNEIPYREDMAIFVKDYYSECRYAMERIAKLYYDIYGIKTVGLRFFSVYGPHEEYKEKYANMITQFLWNLKDSKTPIIYGDGKQSRDFIYVEDVVEACILAMESEVECDIFNVGTGVETSFNQVVDLLNSELGTSVKPKYIENPIKNYVRTTLADTTKAKEGLGFAAKYGLKEGTKRVISYYENGRE